MMGSNISAIAATVAVRNIKGGAPDPNDPDFASAFVYAVVGIGIGTVLGVGIICLTLWLLQ